MSSPVGKFYTDSLTKLRSNKEEGEEIDLREKKMRKFLLKLKDAQISFR